MQRVLEHLAHDAEKANEFLALVQQSSVELTFLSGIELLDKGARIVATLAQLIRDQALLDSVVSFMPTPLPSPAEGIFEPRRRTAEAWLRCYEKAKKVRAGLGLGY